MHLGNISLASKIRFIPPSESACTEGHYTSGCIAVNDPDGKPAGIGGTGPLFTGYLANPLNDKNKNNLTCSENSSWWLQIYTKLDVALNHPERWNWNPNSQSVTFSSADRGYPQNPASATPIDQQFYTMRVFISLERVRGYPARTIFLLAPISP
jgi:hypothetical protein